MDWDGDGPIAAEVTRYVLDGWNNMKPTPIGNERFDIVAELDGTNQLIARYLHGDNFDQTFARVSIDGNTPTVHWLLTDHLNSVRLVLDESGALLDQIAYDAFGNIVAQLNPMIANPIRFASREFDAETGLYSNRARYLDPTTGRWTTQDPLGFAPGDPNLYRYVFNSSTMLVDPSGYWSWSGAWGGGLSAGGAGAGVGAGTGGWLFGMTALPGALIGGGVGFVGGFVVGGIWGNDVGQATGTNDGVGGLILGLPVGLVAGITGPLTYSLSTGAFLTSRVAGWLGIGGIGGTTTITFGNLQLTKPQALNQLNYYARVGDHESYHALRERITMAWGWPPPGWHSIIPPSP